MNTNIILDGFNAILNQLIVTAVAEAIKPLKERILALESGEWTKTQHIVAKEIQPLQNRVIALEINQTLVREGHNDFSEAMRNLLIGYDFINRNDVVDLVDKVVENAIEAYDFGDIIDWDNKIEEGIENYDFSDIMRDIVDEDRVQEMINEALDNLTITRN